jgi:hypothetical protein
MGLAGAAYGQPVQYDYNGRHFPLGKTAYALIIFEKQVAINCVVQ